jgi:hypothetical protein
MSFWSTLFRKSSSNALDRLVYRLDGTTSASGVHVNETNAMRVAAVYSCVRVIAETIGSLPLNMYRRLDDGGRERAATHPLQILLHDRPNPWQTAQEFREMLTEHALLRGAGYAFINWRSRESNIVDELIPLNPDRVQVEQMPDMSLRYTVTTQAGAQIPVAAEDIFHCALSIARWAATGRCHRLRPRCDRRGVCDAGVRRALLSQRCDTRRCLKASRQAIQRSRRAAQGQLEQRVFGRR